VALLLVALGVFNNDLLLTLDLVAGTWTEVSLFWVAVVTAGVVVVTGLAVAFLSRSSAVTTRRKLEKELQGTYERLRAVEAKLPKPAPAQVAVVAATPGAQTAVTGVVMAATVDDASTAAAAVPEAETALDAAAPDAETAVSSAPPEDETVVSSAQEEDETVVAAEAPPADAEDESPPAAS
jgi:hypothetical protein